MLNNNCQPNCVRRIINNQLEIIAVRKIEAGEELSICYSDILLPTSLRQEMFLTTKLFQCSCQRCSDPSELGLNLNNILCDICGNGSPVINNRCNDCKKYFSPDQQSRIQSECEQLSRNIISGGSSACNNALG